MSNKQGLVTAAIRGARLSKAPYDMFGVRVTCTVVGGSVGAVTGQAGWHLEFQSPAHTNSNTAAACQSTGPDHDPLGGASDTVNTWPSTI